VIGRYRGVDGVRPEFKLALGAVGCCIELVWFSCVGIRGRWRGVGGGYVIFCGVLG